MKYNWRQFNNDSKKIVRWIKKEKLVFDNVYGIPRGGLILAVKLSHLLGIPLILNKKKIRMEDYTLVVDDISDTGKTLEEFKVYTIITLFYHKDTITKPDFTLREKKRAWIHFPWEG